MAHLLRSRTTDNLSIVYWAYIYSSSKAIVFLISSPLAPSNERADTQSRFISLLFAALYSHGFQYLFDR